MTSSQITDRKSVVVLIAWALGIILSYVELELTGRDEFIKANYHSDFIMVL